MVYVGPRFCLKVSCTSDCVKENQNYNKDSLNGFSHILLIYIFFLFQIMDMEREKETVDSVISKQSEELKALTTNNEALKNDNSEWEQKLKLMESSREEDKICFKERSTEIIEKDSRIRELQLELDKKVKELEDASQRVEEVSKNVEKEKNEKQALQNEIQGLDRSSL